MRIVNTDNFGGDYPDEKFLALQSDYKTWPLSLPKEDAEKICVILNGNDPYASRYYKTVPDDYKLQPGFTP